MRLISIRNSNSNAVPTSASQVVALEEIFNSLSRINDGSNSTALDGVLFSFLSSAVSNEDVGAGSVLRRALLASAKMLATDVTDDANDAVESIRESLTGINAMYAKRGRLHSAISDHYDRFSILKNPEMLNQIIKFLNMFRSDTTIDRSMRDMLRIAENGGSGDDSLGMRRELHNHILKEVGGLAYVMDVSTDEVNFDQGTSVKAFLNQMGQTLMHREKIDDKIHRLIQGHAEQFTKHAGVVADGVEAVFASGTAKRLNKVIDALTADIAKGPTGERYDAYYEVVQSTHAAATLYKLISRIARSLANDLATVYKMVK